MEDNPYAKYADNPYAKYAEAPSAAAPDEKPGFFSTLGSSLAAPIVKAVEHPIDTASAIYNYPTNTLRGIANAGIQAVLHPVDTANAAIEAAKTGAGYVRGAMQNIRELSPTEFRGSAAPLATPEEMAPTAEFVQNPVSATAMAVARHPYIAATTVATPFLGKLVDAANTAGRFISLPESKMTKATKLVNLLKSNVTQKIDKTARADIVAAQEAHDIAAAALADAQRVPTPTSIGIGKSREMTELGTTAKTAVVDAKQAMEDARHFIDSHLRPEQNKVVVGNEAKGIKFVDTPAIQELIAKIEPIVKPNVTTASATTNVTDPLTKSLYRRVYNSLISKEVDLTAEEAVSAKANKLPVQEITDPVTGKTTYKRTFDSSFQAAENLRRYLGDAFNKDTGAYGAINSNIKKDMYALLDKAQTEYVGAAHTDLQRSYAAFTKDLKPYEETTIGKQLTGTQGTTGIPAYTPADISKILLTGDRSKIDQIFKLAASKDRPAIKQSIADAIETAVNGKSRAAVAEMTKTGSPLSDILEHPALKDFRPSINDYITRLGDAEQAAVTIKNLDLGTFKKSVSEAKKASRAADVTISKINGAKITELPNLLEQQLGKLYTNGEISKFQYQSGLKDIENLSKISDAKIKRSEAMKVYRRHIIRGVGIGTGAGAVGGLGYGAKKYVLD
jgi:hypothetical protein